MGQATMAECPKCGAKVRKEKLRRHVNSVHGDTPKAAKPVARPVPRSTVNFPWVMIGALGLAAGLVAGAWVITRPQQGGGLTPESTVVVIETNLGTIKIELDLSRAPGTAGHFRDLVNQRIFDPSSFHRVAANFVIQGGQSAQASKVNWENTGLKNVKHSVAMARSGSANNAGDSNTATSQFFINLKDNPSLDNYTYPYVVFGRVVEGHSVVDAIGSLYPPSQPNYDGAPTSPVTITRAYIQS